MPRYIKQDSDRGPMSWDRIAKSMGYSIYHVQGKLHGKAIQEARRVWDALPQSEKNKFEQYTFCYYGSMESKG